MSGHAQLSPSSAARWLRCPGSIVLSRDKPNTSSVFADEGTAAHFLAEQCLNGGPIVSPDEFEGQTIGITEDGDAEWLDESVEYRNEFEVTTDMADYVNAYIEAVYSLTEGGEIFVEQQLDISDITCEPGAYGTSDVVAIVGTELQVHDLKYGRGEQIYAKNNEQLRIYARAALHAYELLYDIETVRWFIHQPRLDHLDEDGCDAEALWAWGKEEVTPTAQTIHKLLRGDTVGGEMLIPGDKQCRWCPAKADCPALAEHTTRTVAGDFVDLTTLPEIHPVPADGLDSTLLKGCYESLPLIRQWCEAIEARMRDEVEQGLQPDYKLVAGRRGARNWTDQEAVAKLLKGMRFKNDEMYESKLITPTTAEKLLKGQPRRWTKLNKLITQSDGKPTVAPVSDKRPAIGASTAEFDDIT